MVVIVVVVPVVAVVLLSCSSLQSAAMSSAELLVSCNSEVGIRIDNCFFAAARNRIIYETLDLAHPANLLFREKCLDIVHLVVFCHCDYHDSTITSTS